MKSEKTANTITSIKSYLDRLSANSLNCVNSVKPFMLNRKALIFSMVVFFFLVSVPFTITFYNSFFQRTCDAQDRPFTVAGGVQVNCFYDISGKKWYKILGTGDHTDVFIDQVKSDYQGLRIDASSDGYIPSKVKVGAGDFLSNWPYASTSHGSRIVTTGFFENSAIHDHIVIRTPFKKSFYLSITYTNDLNHDFKNNLYPSIEAGASRIWIGLLTFAALFVCVLLIWQYCYTKRKLFGLLAVISIFLLAIIFHERPYRGMGGYFDGGDDATYVAYTQSIIKHGTPFVCGQYLKMIDKEVDCWQLPGTAFALLPGALAIGALYNISQDDALDIKQVSGMRIMSMIYGLLACLFLFLSLDTIHKSSLNVVLAAFLIWGTSLSKWVFDRAIFTHSIELCLLTGMVYMLCLIYHNKLNLYWGLAFMAIINGLAMQVRPEYILLTFTLPIFIITLLHNKFSYQSLLKALAVCYLISIPAFLFYKMSVSGLRVYQSNFVLSVDSLADLISVGFLRRYFENYLTMNLNFLRSGLVLHSALFLSIFYLIKKRKFEVLILFSLIFDLMYFHALLLYRDPPGMEWQHRYFLKLYPWAILSLAIIYKNSARKIKTLIWIIVIGSLVRQRYEFSSHVLTSQVERYEPVYRYMTDIHMFLRGYEYVYMSNYVIIILLLFTLGFFLWRRKNYLIIQPKT